MTFKWPALRAELTPHSVDTPGGIVGGFLVRCTSTRKELGYVWPERHTTHWHWRTPDGQHFGERSAQRIAVEVLRDAYDLAAGSGGIIRPARLPFEEALKASAEQPPPARQPYVRDRWAAKPASPPPPKPPPPKARLVTPKPPPSTARPVAPEPPPVKKIQWNSVAPMGDVTAALSDAMRRRTE